MTSSPTPATTTTTANDEKQLAAVAANHERSAKEIQMLVQQRVQERNAWKVNGKPRDAMPSLRVALKFLVKMPFQIKIPTQSQLDQDFPVLSMDWEKIQNPVPDQIQVTWLGHASLLIQMNGCNIVTDPIFSARCSPSQWFGPKRYRPPPCRSVAELCSKVNVDLVLISHNHYDHLDYSTVCEFAAQQAHVSFVVPLGLRRWFRQHVSSTVDIYEQDWHEHMEYSKTGSISGGGGEEASLPPDPSTSSNRIRITAVPMRHWSNRTGDRDQTLWCGYSIHDLSHNKKFLFPGDTAWFDDLHDVVGQRYGPWDVAAIPIGAYEPRDFMKYNHINVEEAVQMKEAIGAAAAVPIHWGTFPLTTEPVLEPREKLVELMQQQQKQDASSFAPWLIGETKQF